MSKTPSPPTDRIRIAGLLATEMAVVVGLNALARLDGFRIPWSDLGRWLDGTPFEDVLGAILLLVALTLAYWLLISTVASLLAAASGRRGLIRAVEWLTLPAIRRLADRAVALSLAVSTVAGPLAPAVANPGGFGSSVPVIVEVGEEGRPVPPGPGEPVDEADRDDDIVVPRHLEPTPLPPPAGEGPTVRDGTAARTVIVRRGDHMWSLAESHLAHITGRNDLSEHEIARYWVRVINENRSRIRSGNPDLIYPGEALVLPPVER